MNISTVLVGLVLVIIPLALADYKTCAYARGGYFSSSHLRNQICKLEVQNRELSKRVEKLALCCKSSLKPPPTKQPPIKQPPENLPSCKDLKGKASWLTESKAYTLTAGGQKFQAYCHMGSLGSCGSGPWTMVMKIYGNKQTFHWKSPYWKNKEVYNPEGGMTGLNNEETKLPTYWGTPFRSICLGMKSGGATHWIKIPTKANSLYSLIADGRFRPTRIRRKTWRLLIPNSSLQPYCNREGFNAQGKNLSAAKARIGLIADNSNSPACGSCDSFIGFGTSYPKNSAMDSDSCGNESIYDGDKGARHLKAFGYIFVQ